MKHLLIILLFLSSICKAQDWDSTTYAQFRYDFMNVNIVQVERIKFVDNTTFKPALILLGTFAINQTIITINKNDKYFNTSMVTGSVFIVGGLYSVIVFSKELKKQKRIKL